MGIFLERILKFFFVVVLYFSHPNSILFLCQRTQVWLRNLRALPLPIDPVFVIASEVTSPRVSVALLAFADR